MMIESEGRYAAIMPEDWREASPIDPPPGAHLHQAVTSKQVPSWAMGSRR